MKKQMMSRRLFIALMVAVEVFCLVFAVAFYAYNVVTTFLPFLDRLATKLENDGAIERDSASDPDHALPPSERLVRAIEAYVDEHIAEGNSISEIYTAFSISQPYLSRIFRQYKDCSYNEFLASMRIAKAGPVDQHHRGADRVFEPVLLQSRVQKRRGHDPLRVQGQDFTIGGTI